MSLISESDPSSNKYQIPVHSFIRGCYAAQHPVMESDFVVRSHLVELMRRHELKTAELARLAHVNRSTVTALTRDRATRVDLTALERICTVLGCELGDLLEIVPDEPQRDNNAPAEGET